MAFAERLNRLAVGLLFGAIYFAVVPVFLFARFRDRLGARPADARISFWVPRGPAPGDLESLSRMG
jgi:hypothetical protein